jgi:pimeloyl-ACP methyl ester carboxylesterase
MPTTPPVDGVPLAYSDSGQGTPLLLLHGFPLDRTMWDDPVRALVSRVRLVVPDLRGFGESTAPSGPVTMDRFADDAAALLDHLRIRRAVVCGLSMGGYIAFAFARRHADRLLGLVFCDTRSAPDTPEARKGRAEMIDLVAAKGMAPVADRMLPRLLAPATLSGRPEIAARVRGMILRAPPDGVRGALQGMADRPDSTPILPSLRCPTLFVVGEHDALSPPAEAEGMRAQVPGGRIAVIPDAGHLAPVESPSAVAQALASFVGGLTS